MQVHGMAPPGYPHGGVCEYLPSLRSRGCGFSITCFPAEFWLGLPCTVLTGEIPKEVTKMGKLKEFKVDGGTGLSRKVSTDLCLEFNM